MCCSHEWTGCSQVIPGNPDSPGVWWQSSLSRVLRLETEGDWLLDVNNTTPHMMNLDSGRKGNNLNWEQQTHKITHVLLSIWLDLKNLTFRNGLRQRRASQGNTATQEEARLMRSEWVSRHVLSSCKETAPTLNLQEVGQIKRCIFQGTSKSGSYSWMAFWIKRLVPCCFRLVLYSVMRSREQSGSAV